MRKARLQVIRGKKEQKERMVPKLAAEPKIEACAPLSDTLAPVNTAIISGSRLVGCMATNVVSLSVEDCFQGH